MIRVTANNSIQLPTSTLLRAYDEMSRFETDDIARELEVLELQTAVGNALEDRGFIFDDEDKEYYCPVRVGVLR